MVIRTMMKLAGLPKRYFKSINSADFIDQAKKFEAMDTNELNAVIKFLSTMDRTYPWTVMRAKQVLQWIDSGSYEQVLRAPKQIPYERPEGTSGFCTNCGWALRSPEEFCSGCGRSLSQPQPVQ